LSRAIGGYQLTAVRISVRCVLILVRVYVPAIFVLNKIDAISIEELDLLYKASVPRWRFTSLED
jgi:ribosome-interacting GTPase 1